MAIQVSAGYRPLFAGAAICNAWLAIESGLFPAQFFAKFATVPPDDPVPWSWVALLVGAFVPLYAYAAWRPERGDLPIAVGLAAKVVGPLGWLGFVAAGRAAPSLFPLVLCGDIVWWLPLGWYLLRESRWRSTLMAWFSVAVHLFASVGLLLVARGTELNPDLAQRHQWIVESTGLWVATWTCWSLSSISLLGVCLVWARELRHAARRPALTIACGIVACGVIFDLTGEAVMIVQLTRQDFSLADFAVASRTYQLLSPVIANGLYPLGGLILSSLAWKSGQLRGIAAMAGFIMWFAAIVLTAATLASATVVMTVSGGAIMLLYLYWASVLGWRMRAA